MLFKPMVTPIGIGRLPLTEVLCIQLHMCLGGTNGVGDRHRGIRLFQQARGQTFFPMCRPILTDPTPLPSGIKMWLPN